MAVSVRAKTPVAGRRRMTNVTRNTVSNNNFKVTAVSPDGTQLLVVKDTPEDRLFWARATEAGTTIASATAGTTLPNQGRVEFAEYTADGEVIVSMAAGWKVGELYRSTGWSENPATATWTKVLTLGGNAGVNVKVTRWGFSQAPKGHVREGLVVIAEYGSQSVQSTSTVDGGANGVWLSLDYGRTWRKIFNLFAQRSLKNQHMHGCAYDPWTDAIVICYGDGFQGAPAVSGVEYTRNWLDDADKIVWTPVVGPVSSALYQTTGLAVVPAGLVLASDGGPNGVNFCGRDGIGYKPPANVVIHPNHNSIWTVKNPAPGSDQPWLIYHQNGSDGDLVRLYYSDDGVTWQQVWETTTAQPAWSSVSAFVGPDAFGWYHWTCTEGNTHGSLRGKLGPVT